MFIHRDSVDGKRSYFNHIKRIPDVCLVEGNRPSETASTLPKVNDRLPKIKGIFSINLSREISDSQILLSLYTAVHLTAKRPTATKAAGLDHKEFLRKLTRRILELTLSQILVYLYRVNELTAHSILITVGEIIMRINLLTIIIISIMTSIFIMI